jgi:hypothetical protein
MKESLIKSFGKLRKNANWLIFCVVRLSKRSRNQPVQSIGNKLDIIVITPTQSRDRNYGANPFRIDSNK